jgi:hypothetical protein
MQPIPIAVCKPRHPFFLNNRNRSYSNVQSNSDYTYDVNNNRIAKSVDSNGDGLAEVEENIVLDDAEIALVFDGNGN